LIDLLIVCLSGCTCAVLGCAGLDACIVNQGYVDSLPSHDRRLTHDLSPPPQHTLSPTPPQRQQTKQEPTIGAAFLTQAVVLEDATVKFEIWDTAGQERYRSLAPMYYRCVFLALFAAVPVAAAFAAATLLLPRPCLSVSVSVTVSLFWRLLLLLLLCCLVCASTCARVGVVLEKRASGVGGWGDEGKGNRTRAMITLRRREIHH
jgi:hypothetical protein